MVNANESLRSLGRERGWIVGDTYTEAEFEAAAELVAKALANRENAPRLQTRPSK